METHFIMSDQHFKSKLEKLVADRMATQKNKSASEKNDSSETASFQGIKALLEDTLADANTQLQATGSTLTVISPQNTKNLKSGEFVQVFLEKGENANYAKAPYLLIEADSEDPSQINISDRFFEENDQKIEASNASEELIENTVFRFISKNL